MSTERTRQELGRPVEPVQYAGFWPRFASLCLDGLILGPISLLLFWMAMSRFFLLNYVVLSFWLQLFYEVYLVRRWGGTPGKLIMGLRILKTDEKPVGYREALLRAAPDLIFSLLVSIAYVVASFQITASHYRAIPILERFQRLAEVAPPWYRPLDIAQNVWGWGELIVLLTNRKRRALHDFIAGTVVVVVRKSRATSKEPTFAPSNRL